MAEVSTGLVVGLGVSIVFAGLISIIFILYIMGALVNAFQKKKTTEEVKQTVVPQDTVIPNKGEFIAAVSAAIAEDLGTDISGIRIVSVKKV